MRPYAGPVGRPLRLKVANGKYHVTTRGTGGVFVFLDTADRERFLRILVHVCAQYEWACHMYCLMYSHYHLVVVTKKPNIDRGMHVLNGLYTRTFNKKYERFGHLFAARYRARLVEPGNDSRRIVRYVALNPVKSGLCERPEQWFWSSYGATLGLRSQHPIVDDFAVLDLFGDDMDDARAAMRQFVLKKLPVPGTVQAA